MLTCSSAWLPSAPETAPVLDKWHSVVNMKATSQIAEGTLFGLRAGLPKRQPRPALRRRGAKGAPQSHPELGALAPRATCAGNGENGGRVSSPQDLGAGDGAYTLELPP